MERDLNFKKLIKMLVLNMGLMILYRVAYQLQNKRYLGCRIFAVELTKTMTKTKTKTLRDPSALCFVGMTH